MGVPFSALGLLVVALTSAACGQTEALSPAVPAVNVSAEQTRTDGHERLLAWLERIDGNAKRRNPYQGRGPVDELRSKLDTLPDRAKPAVRFQLLLALGKEELRLGQTLKAIELLRGALAELAKEPKGLPPDSSVEAHFQLAVAYMRQGETQNCCQRRTSRSCILPIDGDGQHSERDGSLKAEEELVRSLELAVPDSSVCLRSRWLLNLAHMTLGTWPDGVPAAWRIEPEVFASDEPFPRFPDVALELGLGATALAGGAIADDFDGDGRIDFLVSNSDTHGQLCFYRQTPERRFVDATAEAGLVGLYGGLNMVHADYDNDGDLDVYVLRGAWWRAQGRHPDSLLQNDGQGHFRDVTFEAGLAEPAYPSQAGAWSDYDNDGDLDLYIGNESDESCPCAAQLFQNQGDGTFVDVAREAGVTNERYAKAVSWGDYDEDGDPDLFVSNMASANRLYRNEGEGTFTDVAPSAGVTLPISSFAAFFWDFDQNGHLDLFACGFGGPSGMPNVADVAASYLGLPVQGEMPHLYRGDGDGHFVDVAREQGLDRYALTMGCNFGDLDNDGRPDLYLGTGYPFYEGLVPNLMYHNRGAAGFADVTTAGGFGHLQKGHGIAFVDFDDDGDQDVFERLGGALPGDAYGNVLFENPGFGNHWLKLRLRGVRSNRWGIGARIALEIEEDGATRWVYKHVGSGGSFGDNPLGQELGVGRATRVRTLQLDWPTSGLQQVFHDVAVDQALEIVEGQNTLRIAAR